MVFEREEDAFWVFCEMVENILPMNYYIEMIGTLVDQEILMELVEKNIPDLYSFFNEVGFDLTTTSLQWFISLFCQTFSIEISFIIWDLLFIDGSITLFKTSLSILRYFKKELMSKSNFEEIYQFMEGPIRELNDRNFLLYTILKSKSTNSLDVHALSELRKVKQQIVLNRLKASKFDIKRYDYERGFNTDFTKFKILENCSENWPVCVFDRSYKFNIDTFKVYQILEKEFEFIPEYFNFEGKEKNPKTKNNANKMKNYIDYAHLLIERKLHVCGNLEKMDNKFKVFTRKKNSLEIDETFSSQVDSDENYKRKFVKNNVNYQGIFQNSQFNLVRIKELTLSDKYIKEILKKSKYNYGIDDIN